jgi:DNA-binding NarL/FixJ family response regulator
VLVVDDYEPFRRVVRSILQLRDDLQIVGEASDGLEAVQKAKSLRPDLVLLDIALPTLNGIQVARRLRDLVPRPKTLFLSVESSEDVVREAFNVGGVGYVHKLHIASELMPAIDTVLGGKQFIGSSLKGEFSEGRATPNLNNHEILLCSDDAALLGGLTRFIAAALNAGNSALVLISKSHQGSLLQRLRAEGADIDGAIRRGMYIAWEEAPDPVRFLEAVERLLDAAAKAGQKHPRVAACGDCAARLWAEGKTDEAIRLEQMSNKIVRSWDVDVLCVYPLSHSQEDDSTFKSICSEHSAISYR